MNDMTIRFGNSDSLTMSSIEISNLTGKRHGDVIRDIRVMIDALGDDADLRHVQEAKDSRGYTQEYKLPKDLTLTLVTGYDVKRRHAINVRWLELEAKPVPPALPDFTNPALAARAWADQVEARQIAESKKLELEHKIEVQAPKVEAFDRISASPDTLTVTEASKVLGVKRKDLTARLHAEGWWYRQNNSWVAYDRYIKAGCLQYKEANYTDSNTGQKCTKPYCHITQKGLAKLALMLGKPGNDSQMKLMA